MNEKKHIWLYRTVASWICLYIMILTPAWGSEEACFITAGEHYKVNPVLLKAIAQKESAMRPSAVNENRGKDGKVKTIDVGMMQINSAHFKLLEDEFSLSLADIQQPCQNIILGAWTLAHCIAVFGNNWEAVGCYNAGTAKTDVQRTKRVKYAREVMAIYNRITNSS